jgi:hypothetical protein
MTNVLPRGRAELITAEYSAGKRIYEIVAKYGHSPQTVRKYALGRSAPGQVTPGEDSFSPFAAYCRRRLDDDPHLRAIPLLAEITALGYPGTDKTFYRALKRPAIRAHPCPDCRIARINGYLLRPPERSPRPFPLAVPLSPVSGETLASFLARLAATNRTAPGTLLGVLHPWFSIRNQWHDDRWQHEKLTTWADEAAECLAAACGSTVLALLNALPAFGGQRRPVRAAAACRLCSAARGIHQPVPVHLLAHHQICPRHGIWLGRATQIEITKIPAIAAAGRKAPRLVHKHGITRLVLAETTARQETTGGPDTRRPAAALALASPGLDPGHPDTVEAAAYPETIKVAAALLRTPGALPGGPD